MALLGFSPPVQQVSGLLAPDLYLRPPRAGDYAAWAALRAESRGFLERWEPAWTTDELSRASFRRRLRHYGSEARAATGHAFFLVRRTDDHLLGGITLSNIRRGVNQSASLGYWVGARHARRGYMAQAIGALLPFVFSGMGLNRLEAACIPSNNPSRRLLERCGFRHEGVARNYICIDGRWQDHLLYAILASDFLGTATYRPASRNGAGIADGRRGRP